ncbi:MAG: hypothetical protein IJI22_01350, partial [Bacilli bacterium]|nr:hypothetical protein [Bacilli bacterium]
SETYHKNNYHSYDIIIKKDKLTFSYTLNENLKKQKKIIKSIKSYKSNNLICIMPIYKKKLKRTLYCTINNQQVSNYYLEESSNEDYQKILNKLKIKQKKEEIIKTKYKKIDIYQNNILKNHKYIIWNYKGFYVIAKEKSNYQKVFDYDLYDNIMATTTKDYFVIFENTSVDGIKKVYYYDMNKEKLNVYKPKIVLSKNSYINGVINNYIYVTDLKEKKEYKIDIRKEKIEEVDEDQTNYFIYDNNKKVKLSKSDYFLDKQLFNNKLLKNEKVTDTNQLRKEYNYYYFYKNNKFYKVMDNNLKNQILLFELEGIEDWYIIDRAIILVKEGTLYYYDDSNGLKEILTSNELKYNYENIYYLWKN